MSYFFTNKGSFQLVSQEGTIQHGNLFFIYTVIFPQPQNHYPAIIPDTYNEDILQMFPNNKKVFVNNRLHDFLHHPLVEHYLDTCG